MKKILLTLSVIVLASSYGVTQNILKRSSVTERVQNTVVKDYKKILIFSAGTRPFRLFSESLSDKLSEEFARSKVESSFFYLGELHDDIFDQLARKLESEQFDAFIILDPEYAKKITWAETFFFGPPSPYRIKDDIDIMLYDTSDYINPVWEIKLDVDLNFTKPGAYTSTAKRIVESMRENNLMSDPDKDKFRYFTP